MPEIAPYAYAKACGIIGKSFIGKGIYSLAGIRSLTELDRLVFPDSRGELTARELLNSFEKRIISRTIRQILVIINALEKPHKLLVQMIRSYEYGDLKAVMQNIIYGEKSVPALCDIEEFATVNFNAFPDAQKMLKNTEFASLFFNELKLSDFKEIDITSIEAKLDRLFYSRLIEYLEFLDPDDRAIIARILHMEISLRNCVWALRLRTYFNKSEKETAAFLLDFKPRNSEGKEVSLAEDAVKSLEYPLDSRQPWENWKWETLLNRENPNENWKADPRSFQNAASQYLYRLTWRSFHLKPASVSSIFCFIKLKQFEEDILTSIAEGFNLGMDSAGVFKLLEVSA